MADLIARPSFYEGEFLPAADLVATVDYSRNQLARHHRYLHRWGIADGLQLQGTKKATATGTQYIAVTLKAGIAVDGYGREIVVPVDVPLDPADLENAVAPQSNIWYPVFLSGRDQAAAPSPTPTPASGSAGALPTRVQELYDITYGAPGSELNPDQQAAPLMSDPPDDGVSAAAWKVLLGYVKWEPNARQFADVDSQIGSDGPTPRYAGVSAAQVVSASGSVRLSTHPASSASPGPVMALEIHEDNKGELVFGKQNADGTLTPALTISASGDLTAMGKVSGAVTPGSTQVQSGQAFDGTILPLAPGVDPAKVMLHVHVSLRVDQLQAPPGTGPFLPVPFECWADPVTRQVHCRVQWWDFSAAPKPGPVLPAFCDYTIIASVAAS